MRAYAVLKDHLSAVFADRRSIYWHLLLLAMGPALLALSWPADSPGDYVGRGAGPKTFLTLVLGTAAYLFTTAGAWSLDQIPARSSHSFSLLIRHTAVNPGAYLIGRVFYHLLHSLFQVVLALPSILAAAAAVLLPPGMVLLPALLLALWTFLVRVCADAGRRYDGKGGSLAMLAYGVILIMYLVIISAFMPRWSVIRALSLLCSPSPEADFGPVVWRTIIMHSLLAAAGLALSLGRMKRIAGIGGTP